MVKLLRPKVRIARRWFKRVGIVFLFFCFLAVAFYLIFKSDFLVIKNVRCEIKEKTSIADENRWCEEAERLLQGRNIISTYLTTAVDKLVDKFLPIGNVVVKRKFPQTVLVEIVERKPIARVCPPGGREFLVDQEGLVYSEVLPEFQNLLRVVLELGVELKVGQTLEPEIVSLIRLEEPRVSAVKFVEPQGTEVKANGQLTIFLSREKNLESQLRALQLIIKKYRIEGKGLKSVDLRYSQPVIKY